MTVVSAFIDSNLFIYALTQPQKAQDQIKHSQAINLFEQLLVKTQIITSVQVVNECHFVLSRKFGFDDGAVTNAIESGILGIAQVQSLELTDYRMASRIRRNYCFSYWDSLVCTSALRSGADTLYSEDMQHGLVVDNRLKIINPFV